MLNFFYIYGYMWIAIIILYSFGWSNMCIKLSPPILIFIILHIIVSLILGKALSKFFVFKRLEKNPHKKPTTTIFIVVFLLINLLYDRNVPLFSVLKGNSMYAAKFSGIPVLYLLFSGFVILYAFYLMYLFICFRKKSLLVEYSIILIWFILLFQRQNIFVILLGSLWMFIASVDYKKISMSRRIGIVILVFIAAMAGLYLFGIIGNVRYGMWSWNDTSMIETLARINNKWPKWLPKMYVWAYVYIVSPLANLQYNFMYGVQPSNEILDYLYTVIPYFVYNKIGSTYIKPMLIIDSLNVCTAFSVPYRISGMIGVYFIYMIEVIILLFEFIALKNNRYFVPFCIGWGYFYFMNFFTNPLSYEITSFMIIYPLLLIIGTLNKKSLSYAYKYKTKSKEASL